MPGFNFWNPDYPYIGFSLHGAYGKHLCFRYRYKRQEAVPFYIPSNPRTPRQQAWRWVFAQAILFWHSLTSAQHLLYNQRARCHGPLSGFNFAVSEYLRAFPPS